MNAHIFPTLEDLIGMHDILIEKYGGAYGIRDVGALESALMRPQIGYYNGLLEEAAALLESLAINHAFIDGNKRIAFAATETFLGLDGYYLDCADEDAYVFFMQLFESNSFRFANLLPWIEEHVRHLP